MFWIAQSRKAPIVNGILFFLTTSQNHCKFIPMQVKSKTIFAIFVFSILFGMDCAYFNTFYNAKKYYHRGLEEYKKSQTEKLGTTTSTPSSRIGGSTYFQRAVEKALKLLEYYPKSRYVDDALLLLGNAYYYQGEYLSALRRYEELLEKFPQSEFRFQAEMGRVRCHVALREWDLAEEILSKIVSGPLSKKEKGEAYFYRGKLFENQKDFASAAEAFENALEWAEESLQIEAALALGASCDSIRAYDRAVKAFRQVLKLDPTPEIRLEAQIRLAEALKYLGEYAEAIRLLENLLGEEKNKSRAPEMRLELGDCLARKGDIEGAILTYQDVIQANSNTEHSAKAHYALGVLYEKEKKDYERALEHFLQVKKQFARSVKADSAELKARDIFRLKALREVISAGLRGQTKGDISVETVSSEEDSLFPPSRYIALDSLWADSLWFEDQIKQFKANQQYIEEIDEYTMAIEDVEASDEAPAKKLEEKRKQKANLLKRLNLDKETLPDSVRTAYLVRARQAREKEFQAMRKAENPELTAFNVEELDKNLFLLGELYFFRFSLPDSALRQHHELVTRFPNSPYAPQSLYSLFYIYLKVKKDSVCADSCAKQILSRYPTSIYARAVRKVLHANISTIEDTLDVWFSKAEEYAFKEKDVQSAVHWYSQIFKNYPQSDLAPKALYATAWIYENELDSLQLAKALYDTLSKKYEATPYGEKARQKLEGLKMASAQTALPKEPVQSLPVLQETKPDSMRSEEKHVPPSLQTPPPLKEDEVN